MTSSEARWKRFIDAALELLVVPSFTRIGYHLRRRIFDWGEPNVAGTRVVITGANSGLGFAAAKRLSMLGADVTIVARSPERGQAALEQLVTAANGEPAGGRVTLRIADLSSIESVTELASRLEAHGQPIDVLIHNAGSLHSERMVSGDGIELTLATHVVGPFLLTHLLTDLLRRGNDARVITMASGGLYTQAIDLTDLQSEQDYTGAVAYARAKRAQLILNALWAQRLAKHGINVHTIHPGWVDTAGIKDALPGFSSLMRPMLRTPAEGADTMVWLASQQMSSATPGRFWHDRRERPEHRIPRTRPKTPQDADLTAGALWGEISRLAGLSSP